MTDNYLRLELPLRYRQNRYYLQPLRFKDDSERVKSEELMRRFSVLNDIFLKRVYEFMSDVLNESFQYVKIGQKKAYFPSMLRSYQKGMESFPRGLLRAAVTVISNIDVDTEYRGLKKIPEPLNTLSKNKIKLSIVPVILHTEKERYDRVGTECHSIFGDDKLEQRFTDYRQTDQVKGMRQYQLDSIQRLLATNNVDMSAIKNDTRTFLMEMKKYNRSEKSFNLTTVASRLNREKKQRGLKSVEHQRTNGNNRQVGGMNNHFRVEKTREYREQITQTAYTEMLFSNRNDRVSNHVILRGGVISMPTGAGKTVVAISFLKFLAQMFNERGITLQVLVVIGKKDPLLSQWENRLAEFNDIESKVSLFQGLNVEIKKMTSDFRKEKTYARNEDLLLSPSNDLKNYHVIFFDECHHAAAKSYQEIVKWIHPYALIVGLSATAFDRLYDNIKTRAVVGSEVFAIELSELIRLGYLVDARVQSFYVQYTEDGEIYLHNSVQEINKCKNTSKAYQMAVKKLIVNNDERNKGIVKIAYQEAQSGHVLIQVKRVAHGKILYDELIKMFIDKEGIDEEIAKKRVVYLHGSSKNRQTVLEQRYPIVIGTTIFDEGVDLPHLNAVILAADGDGYISLMQKIGRVLRIDPDLQDASRKIARIYTPADYFSFFRKHSQQRLNYLKQNFNVDYIDVYPSEERRIIDARSSFVKNEGGHKQMSLKSLSRELKEDKHGYIIFE